MKNIETEKVPNYGGVYCHWMLETGMPCNKKLKTKRSLTIHIFMTHKDSLRKPWRLF